MDQEDQVGLRSPFQEYVMNDLNGVAQWVNQRNGLYLLRHVAYGGVQPRKQGEGHDNEEDPEQSLLHGGDNRRDHEPYADGRNDEKDDAQVEDAKRALERNPKLEERNTEDYRRLHKAYEDARQRLAEHDLRRAKRAHK